MLSFCPSPEGSGSQLLALFIFLREKLLNVKPNVPVSPIPPPKPADKFSRQDIIRTQRELSQLGFLNAEKINQIGRASCRERVCSTV